MIDLKGLQREIYDNQIAKGFNTTDVNLAFCHTYKELAEAFEAHRKKSSDVGEELADVTIFLLSLARMFGVDLEDEVNKKVLKNRNRKYKKEGDGWTKVE